MTQAQNPLLYILKADPERYLNRPAPTLVALIKALEGVAAFLYLFRVGDLLLSGFRRGGPQSLSFLPPDFFSGNIVEKVLLVAVALCVLALLVCTCVQGVAGLLLRFSLQGSALLRKTQQVVFGLYIALLLLFLCLCGVQLSGYVKNGMQFVRQVQETTGITGLRDLPNAGEKLSRMSIEELQELLDASGLTEFGQMLTESTDLSQLTDRLKHLDGARLLELVGGIVSMKNPEALGGLVRPLINGKAGLIFLIAVSVICGALLLLLISYSRGWVNVLTAIEYELRFGYKETGLGTIRLTRDAFLLGLLALLAAALYGLGKYRTGFTNSSVFGLLALSLLTVKYFAVLRSWKFFKKCHR